MEKYRIIVGTKNVNLNSLTQNDSLQEKSLEEARSGGPVATRPIVYSILSLKNSSMAQNHFDFMRITMTEGKNRMIEQIDDSNMTKALNQTTESQAAFMIKKLVEIISNEINYGFKIIQLIYLIETGIAVEYRGFIKLDETMSFSKPLLKELDDYNKRANILFNKVLIYIDENFINKAHILEQKYLSNPDVTDNMKNYLKVVGIDWIKNSKNVGIIYKSFKRKAKMSKAQYEILRKFVVELRESLSSKLDMVAILNIFKLDYEYYSANKSKALEPIDDFLESIENFGDDEKEF